MSAPSLQSTRSPLHSWDLSAAEAIALQKELAGQVRIAPITDVIGTVAGIDCAFDKKQERILAAAVLCNARTMEIVAQTGVDLPCTFPYIPGLLSFREAPAVIEAVSKLPERPDLVMCDGQGIAHPRRLGLASHVGLWLDIPTIGVAKSLFCGTHRAPGRNRRCRTQLLHRSEVIGSVVRTRTGVKPLYISAGHHVTLADAVRWVLKCTRGCRLPEPTRQAHIAVTKLKQTLVLD